MQLVVLHCVLLLISHLHKVLRHCLLLLKVRLRLRSCSRCILLLVKLLKLLYGELGHLLVLRVDELML
jgi:hypothetical protein